MGIDQQSHLRDSNLIQLSPTIVVVGNGPVGVHFVNRLIKEGFNGKILLFGDEPYAPYNRVLLSAFLNGEVELEQLANPISPYQGLITHHHCRVVAIDRDKRTVTDERQGTHKYSKLILATGSSPFIPNIPGTDLNGVFRFRDMRDTEKLFARRVNSRRTLVIGGGLLGLETAKAMQRHATEVIVVQHTPNIMNRQLDDRSSELVRAFAESNGLAFRLNLRVAAIQGSPGVESVLLSSGEQIPCDTVIFATGITPNIELARACGLAVRQGIQIDEDLATNDSNIFAIGECADFHGQVFGLIAPGLEQASVLATRLMDNTCAQGYQGSTLITQLKVLGLSVFSMGKVTDEYARQFTDVWRFEKGGVYRSIFISKGRIVGAIAIGNWSQVNAVQQAIEQTRYLFPWQQLLFVTTGRLFYTQSDDVHALPDSTVVCNCQNISLGAIRQCMKTTPNCGRSVEQLQTQLPVASVCGSCKPLVQEILQKPKEILPVKVILLGLALLASTVLALWLISNPLPISETVQKQSWDWLWTDGTARQTSGFTILGLSVISLLLSLRKRLKFFSWLSFDFWRHLHLVLTLVALAVLIVHTGFSWGQGLNGWLITNFMLVASMGVASAALASLEGRLPTPTVKRLKRGLTLGHILTLWPLPILLTFHILSVYYF